MKGASVMYEKTDVKLAHHHTAVCCSHWEDTVAFYKALGFVLENDWYWPDGVKNHKSLLSYQGLPDCWMELFEYPEGKNALNERYTHSAGCVYEFALEAGSPASVDRFWAMAVGTAGGRSVMAPANVCVPGEKGPWKTRQAILAGVDGEHIAVVFDEERCAKRGGESDGILGFHHNALRVAALPRSIEFYTAMGFSLRDVYTGADSVRFALLELSNGNGLLLREDGKSGLPSDVERMRAAGSMFQYCFRTECADDIDRIYDHCLRIGGRERIKPFWHEEYGEAAWVDHPAFAYGPDDEILEFLYIDYRGKEPKHE